MSSAEVKRVMGDGEIVRYRRIHLVDPWRSEAFQLTEGPTVLILYYVTQPPHRYNTAASQDTTPIVFEDDQVVGWGWSYVRANHDRYPVDGSLHQP